MLYYIVIGAVVVVGVLAMLLFRNKGSPQQPVNIGGTVELMSEIRTMRSRGFTDEQIRSSLTMKGHSVELIDMYLRRF
jgi:hypothetical protein